MRTYKSILALPLSFVLFGCGSKVNVDVSFLNEKLSPSFSKLVLAYEVTIGEDKLTGEYVSRVTDDALEVSYSFNIYAEISFEGMGEEPYLKNNIGSYTFHKGKEENKKGEECNLPSSLVTLSSFSFANEDYQDVSIENGNVMVAKIVDLGKLFNLKGNYKNSFINVHYSTAVDNILISFLDPSAHEATLTYTFYRE